MSAGRRASGLRIAAAGVCVAVAAWLLQQYWQRPAEAFDPSTEDLCIVMPARVAPARAWDPSSSVDRLAARPVPPDARCPVCGMYPARHPKWAAQLIFDDGAVHFFDSPVDLFIFLADPGQFDPARADSAAAAMHVSDFSGVGWLEARYAHYVKGSSARGPMRGADLPAFGDPDAARAFAAQHGGEVIGFGAIDAGTIATLRDANHAGHDR